MATLIPGNAPPFSVLVTVTGQAHTELLIGFPTESPYPILLHPWSQFDFLHLNTETCITAFILSFSFEWPGDDATKTMAAMIKIFFII